ncbi:MAG: DUF4188 domain-containing protein [Deltaproteobacteria bacterium]|nr:DUF4188 domain-containing protein [Deltaproteobacteria bacterium]MBW2394709.1 DUF4188 domain-containing protein [Deltaproteobacteria bacterium]
MTEIRRERITAAIDEEVLVFLIGMRINHYWKVHKWLPVARAMGRMVREIEADPDSGFLAVESWSGNPSLMVQYWRSFEHLERYAVDKLKEHQPAWAAFNQAIDSNGDVGIWHETYRVRVGDYECVYNNMPSFGLARATQAVPATGRLKSAVGRLAGA